MLQLWKKCFVDHICHLCKVTKGCAFALTIQFGIEDHKLRVPKASHSSHSAVHQAMESHLNSKTFLVLFFLTFAQTCYGAVVLFSSLPQTLVVSASPKQGQGNTLSFQLSLISIMLCIELIRIE